MCTLNEEDIMNLRIKGRSIDIKEPLKLIDLFCGAGGLTLGFTSAYGHNFKPVFANDNNLTAAKTYNANFGEHCINDDIESLLKDPQYIIPKADVVIGGPPCQGFSLLNKNRKDDRRNQLWRPFLDVVEKSGAEVFLMENVPQLLGSLEFEEIRATAQSMGFLIESGKLCAADYGVPQTRWRAFILGCRFTDPSSCFPPRKTNYNSLDYNIHELFPLDNSYISDPKVWRTVRDAISDLPKPVGTEIREESAPLNLHFGRSPRPESIARYKAIPKEGMNRFDLQKMAPELTPPCWIRKKNGGTDLFGRLWWDKPAFTIRTEFFKPEKGRYLHPVQHRPITHREAARLQSFPDSFIFTGSKIEIARQIGNAVPPLLAARLADSVTSLFLKKKDSNGRHLYQGKKKRNNVACQKS